MCRKSIAFSVSRKKGKWIIRTLKLSEDLSIRELRSCSPKKPEPAPSIKDRFQMRSKELVLSDSFLMFPNSDMFRLRYEILDKITRHNGGLFYSVYFLSVT